MTTDPFTIAARRHSRELWTRTDQRIASEEAAHWARDHLAAQEPADAEVEAVARALAHWDGASGWGTPAWDGEITEAAYIYGAHMALLAARAARRDEEAGHDDDR